MTYALNANKFLSQKEREKALEILRAHEQVNKRDAVLLEFLMFTGARPSEVLGLAEKAYGVTRESFGAEPDEDGELVHFVHIEGLKGSNSRTVPIPAELYAKVMQISENLKPKQKIFSITLRRLQQIWAELKPVDKPLKCLRHTFALQSYQKTRDLQVVRRTLGHRNINNTMIYMDYFHTLKELKKIL